MGFKIEDYRDRVQLASGDFRLEFLLRGWSKADLVESIALKSPEILRHTGDAFLDAGARLLVAPTDSANELVLGEEIKQERWNQENVRDMNRACVRILRSAVDAHPNANAQVLGAIGPTPGLMCLGEVQAKEIESASSEQARMLAEGGADAILMRGFTEIDPLIIAVDSVRKTVNLPVIASLIFDAGIDFTETAMGVSVAEACRRLVEAEVVAIGCDHGEFPDATPEIVRVIRKSCELPIWVEVNAGQPELNEGIVVYPEMPQEFAARLDAIAAAGAAFIGGGWGASVDHTAAMSRALARHAKRAATDKKS